MYTQLTGLILSAALEQLPPSAVAHIPLLTIDITLQIITNKLDCNVLTTVSHNAIHYESHYQGL